MVIFRRPIGFVFCFDLGERFDVVPCLGSSIGYARTEARLRRTLHSVARRLIEGGVLVVESWSALKEWADGRWSADLTDEPDPNIARVLVSGVTDDGAVLTLDIHQVRHARPGAERFRKRREMGLFTAAHDRWALGRPG